MALPLTSIAIEGYRSVRRLNLATGHLTMLVGRNGVGKTNLYRALELVAAAARGTITREIAGEGGVESVLWAGKRRTGGPVRLRLGVEFGDFTYRVEIGLPAPMEAALSPTEPMVKAEELALSGGHKPVVLLSRKGPSAWLRDGEGRRIAYERVMIPSETALAGFQDSGRYAELDAVRRALLDWRFYHDFRTDKGSPIRRPPLAITTPTLSSDGADLAAALATVIKVRGEAPAIDAAVEDAFPGASLAVDIVDGRALLSLQLADMPRPLSVHEFSDGTIGYLCLVAALSGYRLPGFVALNEPENSLHPDLIRPLARLIARAAERTQVWVVTHSEALAATLAEEEAVAPRVVVKRDGTTWIEGLKVTGEMDEEEEEEED